MIHEEENDPILKALMWSGSDNYIEKPKYWLLGSILTATELFTFLLVINLLQTDTLQMMRDHGVVRDVTIILCCGLLFKTITHYFIEDLMDIIPTSSSEHQQPTKNNVNGTVEGKSSNYEIVQVSDQV